MLVARVILLAAICQVLLLAVGLLLLWKLWRLVQMMNKIGELLMLAGDRLGLVAPPADLVSTPAESGDEGAGLAGASSLHTPWGGPTVRPANPVPEDL